MVPTMVKLDRVGGTGCGCKALGALHSSSGAYIGMGEGMTWGSSGLHLWDVTLADWVRAKDRPQSVRER